MQTLNSSRVLLYTPVVVAQGSFVQLGSISSGEIKHSGSIPSTKKASTPSE
jgi:hypothetical protein